MDDHDDLPDYEADTPQRFIFVIGAPGAGKGTLSKRLARDYDCTHISIGDLLRENAENYPAIGWHVKNGKLLPSPHLFPLLRETFRDSPSGCPIIVDGFPRTLGQAREFERVFAEPHLALFFQCPWELAKERVVNRREGREGDNSECFDKRYKEYIDENPAILNYYGSVRGKDKLIEVNTSGGVEASYEKLRNALRGRTEWKELVGHLATTESASL